eukprot:4454822-Lingulodinium_polyedra.AAC.1
MYPVAPLRAPLPAAAVSVLVVKVLNTVLLPDTTNAGQAEPALDRHVVTLVPVGDVLEPGDAAGV